MSADGSVTYTQRLTYRTSAGGQKRIQWSSAVSGISVTGNRGWFSRCRYAARKARIITVLPTILIGRLRTTRDPAWRYQARAGLDRLTSVASPVDPNGGVNGREPRLIAHRIEG